MPRCQATIGKFSLVAFLLRHVYCASSSLPFWFTLRPPVSKNTIVQSRDNRIAKPFTLVSPVDKANLVPVLFRCPDVHNVARIKWQLISILILEGLCVVLAACVWYVWGFIVALCPILVYCSNILNEINRKRHEQGEEFRGETTGLLGQDKGLHKR